MKQLLRRLPQPTKILLKSALRQTFTRLPASSSRLTGQLAKNGGKPVRDVRLRPWASSDFGKLTQWNTMRGLFRRIFLSGVEGLPQPLARQFAGQWAAYCGCRYGLLVGHGTDALRFGLAAALDHDGLEYGGEIIVPNFSYIASATAALDRRFGVAFVDVDPRTLLLDPVRVEEAIIPGKTRAIIPVHLFGQPADMSALKAIAQKHGLKIIEDAAQAHGAAWSTGPVGSLGDVGAFSFQSSKNLASGEGGAIVTNDEEIFRRAYSLHNAGRSFAGEGRWEHLSLGWNCRITEYQAGLLIHRFGMFDRQQATRRKNFQYLLGLMGGVACLQPLASHRDVRAHGMYMFVMRYKKDHCGGQPIEAFLDLMQAEGIPIHRAFSAAMSEQPVLRNLIKKRPEYFRQLPTPVAEQAAKDTVFIPQDVFLGTASDMEDIVGAISKVERYCSNTKSVDLPGTESMPSAARRSAIAGSR